jgi:hypothetical protein
MHVDAQPILRKTPHSRTQHQELRLITPKKENTLIGTQASVRKQGRVVKRMRGAKQIWNNRKTPGKHAHNYATSCQATPRAP